MSDCTNLIKKSIELIKLPDLDMTTKGVLRGYKLTDAIEQELISQMEPSLLYVVSVTTLYVSGRAGHVRRRTTHYIAKRTVRKAGEKTDSGYVWHFGSDSVWLSSYPVNAFGEPEKFFK